MNGKIYANLLTKMNFLCYSLFTTQNFMTMVLTILVKERKNSQRRIAHSEVLLDNIVTTDVQNLFLPLNILQKFVLSSKYKICDNFIFPNGRRANSISLISLIAFVLLTGIQISRKTYTILNSSEYQTYDYISTFCIISSLCLSVLGHIIAFIANVNNNNLNVRFVLNIQKLLKSLNFCKKIIKRLIIWNWFYCVLTLIQFLSLYILRYTLFTDFNLLVFLCDCSLIIFDANAVNAIRVTVLIKSIFKKWFHDVNSTKMLNAKINDLYCKRMFETYVNILNLYEMFIEVFQDTVSQFKLRITDFGVLKEFDYSGSEYVNGNICCVF